MFLCDNLNAYYTFHQPREVRTNRCMDNKGIFKKITKKQEHLTASLVGSKKQVSALVLLGGLFSLMQPLYL